MRLFRLELLFPDAEEFRETGRDRLMFEAELRMASDKSRSSGTKIPAAGSFESASGGHDRLRPLRPEVSIVDTNTSWLVFPDSGTEISFPIKKSADVESSSSVILKLHLAMQIFFSLPKFDEDE